MENSQDGNIYEVVGQPGISENPCFLSNEISNNGREELEENTEKDTSIKQLSNEMYQENKKLPDKHEKEEIPKDEFVDVDVKVEILEEDPSGKGDLLNSIGKELAAGIKKEFYKNSLEMLDFKCPECLKIFKKERYLKMHIKEVHMEAQMSICHICCKEFKSFHLKRHIKNVHIKEECSCDECGKVYTNRKHLRDHKKAVHEGLDLLCHLCCKSFKSKSYLSNHIRRFHNAVDEELICDYCSKLFQSQNKLYLHIKAVHTIENLPCHECGKIYKNSYLLRKHIKHNHPSEQTSELTQSNILKSGVIPNSETMHSAEVAQIINVMQNNDAMQNNDGMQNSDAMQNSEAVQSRNVIQHVMQHSDPAMMDMEMAQERDAIQIESDNSFGRQKSDSIPSAGIQKNIGILSPHPMASKTF